MSNQDSRHNVLIVDDVPENIQTISNILYQRGINISIAQSGKETLKMVSRKPPDLILLDIIMPEMDGFEVCENLKQNPETRDIPIIFLTAKIYPGDIVRGFELGAVDYITKPFNPSELVSRVFTHLELKRSRDLITVQNHQLAEKNKQLDRQNREIQELHALKEKYLSDSLRERVKELNCLYGISSLVEKPDILLSEILQGTVELIPTALQYPETTCVRIVVEDQEIKTKNFRETLWKQINSIVVYGEPVGRLEAYYLEEKPESDEGSLLKEERNLLNAVAERLGRIIERMQAEAKIKHLNAVLHAIRNVNQLIIKEKNPDQLIQHACDNLIETRGFSTAKIVLMDASGKLVKAVEAGLGEKFQRLTEFLESDNLPYCFRQGLAQSEVVVIKNSRAVCGECPLVSLFENDQKMIVRLEHSGKIYGLLMVSLPKTLFTDEEEQSLLKEVAEDIAFTLHATETEEERREAEESLYNLKKAIETLHVGVTITSTDGEIIYTNPAEARMHGYKVEDLLGKDVAILAPSELRNPMPLELIRTLKPRKWQSVNIRKDGSIFPVQLISDIIRDVEGNPSSIVTICEDITERKQTEKILQQSEERFRSIFDNMSVGMALVDKEGCVVTANEADCRFLNYSQEELIGMHFSRFTYPEDLDSDLALYNALIQGERDSYAIDKRYIRKGGELVWGRLSVSLIRDDEGQPQYLTVVCEDITERKKAEEALRISEQQYRCLAEHVADGVVILQDGKVVFINQALLSMTGYTAEQLLQHDSLQFIQNCYKEEYRKRLKSVKDGSRDYMWETPRVTADGQKLWTEEHHSCIQWKDKPAILITVRDITKRKRQEFAIQAEKDRLKKANITLIKTLKDRYRLGDIIGKSPAMQEVYELILNASASNANIVISGESGTGKELAAWTIHKLSQRCDKAFVPVNCGAIPDNLFESEFFGYRKGAFTGAHKDKPGFFEYAHGGTLFLDEIAELRPDIQVKLLRALAGGEYTPLGDHTVKKADVRIITATNRDLAEMVKQEKMREDFYYRINIISVTLPPLQDRREDIPLLVDHFLKQFGGDPQPPVLPGNILQMLYEYDWPGNVRELQNTLQRYLTTKHLDFIAPRGVEPIGIDEVSSTEFNQERLGFCEAVKAFEKQFVLRVLDQNHWHRTSTAAMLGISRRSLFRLMDKHGLI